MSDAANKREVWRLGKLDDLRAQWPEAARIADALMSGDPIVAGSDAEITHVQTLLNLSEYAWTSCVSYLYGSGAFAQDTTI